MSKEGNIAKGWWHYLNDPKTEDRASLARLRRCKTALEAASIPAGLRLARKLCAGAEDQNLDKALALAILLAHVREDAPQKPMRAVGWKTFPSGKDAGETPVLSELRFRKLLQTTPQDRFDKFKRLVRLMKGAANVAELAQDFWDWDDELRGDKVKKRWAFDYYAAANPQPQNEPEGDAA